MSNANENGNDPKNEMHELSSDEAQKIQGGAGASAIPSTWGVEKANGCIVTSATMQIHHGKDDDCDELQTFRKYRDTYLVNQPDGKIGRAHV